MRRGLDERAYELAEPEDCDDPIIELPPEQAAELGEMVRGFIAAAFFFFIGLQLRALRRDYQRLSWELENLERYLRKRQLKALADWREQWDRKNC